MKLMDLVKGLDVTSIYGNAGIEISNIAYDSRKVSKDGLFVCIEGYTVDGHDFIYAAIANGAKALLVEKDVSVPEGITVIRVKSTKYALAHVSNSFFGCPSKNFNLIGVTGTNGKTTTTFMIKSILESARLKVGLIGTIANYVGSVMIPSEKTTPDALELQSIFAGMVGEKVDSVVMEVSSQGLAHHRVSCADYDIGVFTNLSRDHIGPTEHKDMEDYLNSKIKLFNMCKRGLVNLDCSYAARVMKNASCHVMTYGIESCADIRAVDIVKKPDSVSFKVVTGEGDTPIRVNSPGLFSVYNALAAIGVSRMRGIGFEDIARGFERVSVPGRAEMIHTGMGFNVMVDYAHSPDSLEKILSTVREHTIGRILCVFGCPGERDIEKRSMMGEISGRMADFTIITTDNPKGEDPAAIIQDIERGIRRVKGNYIPIPDREQAIRYALASARLNDIVLFAGKGHETCQLYKNRTVNFNERQIVADILKEMRRQNDSNAVLSYSVNIQELTG